jgi:SAM-dependent MidA family methyltransferase
VGPLFGELLAARFAAWLVEDEADSRIESGQALPLQLVEAGAHDGRLARDILTWLRAEQPGVYGRVDYRILEPSPTRQQWQQETLQEFAGKICWPGNWPEMGQVRGIIFSNELLDAMPVQRLVWSRNLQDWQEARVSETDGRLIWTRSPLAEWPRAAGHLRELPDELRRLLPDGFTTEISDPAVHWWRNAAQILADGRLVTLDYGLEAEEFLQPSRTNGTLRAYCGHRFADNLLDRPGEQDLTAHVNFTAVRRAGEQAGLTTETFESQGTFLSRIATRIWPGTSDNAWTPKRIRQFQTLTHPQHLGHSFRVLVQRRPPAA